MARNRRAHPKPMNPLKRMRVRWVMLLNLARVRKWDDVYALIDNGEAGIDDFDHVGRPVYFSGRILPRCPDQAAYGTPLYEAVCQHDAIAMDKLMQRGATVFRYVFTAAVRTGNRTGNIDMAERFVQNGFDVTTLIEVRPPIARVCDIPHTCARLIHVPCGRTARHQPRPHCAARVVSS